MATTYTSTMHYGEWLKSIEYRPACAGGTLVTTGTSVLDGQIAVLDYVRPESRAYPVAPLYLSMTQRAKVYRDRIHYATRRTDSTKTANCSGVLIPYPVETYTHENILSTLLNPPDVAAKLSVLGRLMVKKDLVNLADTIGEYRECIDMVSTAGTGLWEIVEKVRASWRRPFRKKKVKYIRVGRTVLKRRKTFVSQMRSIPTTILVADFGLAPLAGLIDDSVTAWNDRLGSPFIRRVSATATSTLDSEVAGVYGGSAKMESSRHGKAIWYVELSALRQSQRFTSGNILEAVWAGIPFSFVVDYFLKVGDWLSSFDALTGVTTRSGCCSYKVRQLTVDDRVLFKSTSTYKYSIHEPGWRHYHSFERTNALPLTITGRPEYRPSFSIRRLRDLMSVLVSSLIGNYIPKFVFK